VLAFGDSLTAGFIVDATGTGAVDAASAYPARLLTLLLNQYPAQSFAVVNAGQVGETAAAGAARLPGELAAHAADVVLLLEGINDIHGSIGEPSIAPALQALAAMIDEARGRSARVMVATLPPAVPGALKPGTVALIAEFNAQLASVASAHGATLVDVNAALAADVPDWIGPDGLHPTAAGYQRLAQAFFDALVTAFRESRQAHARMARD